MIPPINQNWIDKADEKLQKSEVSYWGNAFFYENKLGKALLFLTEAIKYVFTLSNLGFRKGWDKPNYFKINLPQGQTTYYDRDAALRIGYSHLLVTLPLHRVKGEIEQDSSKVPNPMHRRKLQLLHALLDDQVAIRATLLLAKKLAIASPRLKENLDQYLLLQQNQQIIDDTLSSIQKSPAIDHKKESDAIVKSLRDRLRQESFQNLDKLYDECVHEEMEKALEAYDIIHPEKDAKKYDELTNFLAIRSHNIPAAVLSKEARSVIDLAGRIDRVARSNLKIDRKTFLALISGAQMLPINDVADASVLNKRAYRVAQESFRLVKAGNIRKVLQHTPQEDIRQILESSKKFILHERLQGTKRKAFIEKIKEYISLESKKGNSDGIDEKRDLGFFEWMSHKITMKNNFILDSDEIYEVFSQLGLITEDRVIVEKRLEVYSFLEAYRSFKHANSEGYRGDKNLYMIENKGNIRYQFAAKIPENTPYQKFSYEYAMTQAFQFADNPSILPSNTLIQFSESIYEDLNFLRKKVGYLTDKSPLSDEDKGKLETFQRLHRGGFDVLDKVLAELKLRNVVIPETIARELRPFEQYKHYSEGLMGFRYLLENNEIPEMIVKGQFAKIKELQKQAKQSLELVDKQLKEGKYVGWSSVNLEQLRVKLNEHIWILSLLADEESLNNLRIIDESEQPNARFGSMEEQLEILKEAPASIKGLPKTQINFLKNLWQHLDVGALTYPNLIEHELTRLRQPENQEFIKQIKGQINLEGYFRDLAKMENLLKYSIPLCQKASAAGVDTPSYRELSRLANLLVSSKERLIVAKLTSLYQEFTTDTEMGRLLKRMNACVKDNKYYRYQKEGQANHEYAYALNAKGKINSVLADLIPSKETEQIIKQLNEIVSTFSKAANFFSNYVQESVKNVPNHGVESILVSDNAFKVDSGVPLKLEAEEKYKVEPKMIIKVIPPGAKDTSLEIAKKAYEEALRAVDKELTEIRGSHTSGGQEGAVLEFIRGPLLKNFFERAQVWEDLVRQSVGKSKDLSNLEELRKLSEMPPDQHFHELEALLKSWQR